MILQTSSIRTILRLYYKYVNVYKPHSNKSFQLTCFVLDKDSSLSKHV